jgi:hypothetical protein
MYALQREANAQTRYLRAHPYASDRHVSDYMEASGWRGETAPVNPYVRRNRTNALPYYSGGFNW